MILALILLIQSVFRLILINKLSNIYILTILIIVQMDDHTLPQKYGQS